MTAKTAVFAPDDVCTRLEVKKSLSEDGLVVCGYKDWSFTSFHSTMVDSAELDAIQEEIVSGVDKDYQLHVPPMVFDNDVIKLSIGSFVLEFKAKEALRVWAQKHATTNGILQVLEVPYAKEWKEKSLFAQGKAPVTDTDQAGGSDLPQSKPGESTSQAANEDESVFTKVAQNTDMKKKAWDWTFSSDYCGSISNNGVSNESVTLTGLVTAGGKEIIDCLPCTESGINYDMLRNRTDPILFYDEVLLYQDDLEDCGEVTFDVKLRVMPSCWFILSRMFLRVDHVMIRLVESRHFHQFGTKEVSLDVTLKECAIGEAKPQGNSSTAGLPHVNIPTALQRDGNRLSQMAPTLSQRYFKLQLDN